MTIGSRSYDAYYLTPGFPDVYPYTGPQKVGRQGSKSWSGADSDLVWYPREDAWRLDKKQFRFIKYSKDGGYEKFRVAGDGWNAYTMNTWISTCFLGPTGHYSYFTAYGGFQDTTPVWDSNATLKVLSKLASAVRGHDFQMGVFLGEGKQACEMILDSGKRVVYALLAVRRGDLKKAYTHLFSGVKPHIKSRQERFKPRGPAKFTGDVSSNWLQLQYGWLPLINDVYEASCALFYLTNREAVTRYRVRHTLSAPVVSSSPSHWRAYGHARTRRQLIVDISDNYSPAASLGLLDPELVLWELLPFSFVFDWFIPIGNYLQTRATLSRLDVRRVLQTDSKHMWAINGDYIGPKQSQISMPAWERPYWSWYDAEMKGLEMSAIYSSASVTRTIPIVDQFHVPTPNFKPLESVASWKHAANFLALVTQKASSKAWHYAA